MSRPEIRQEKDMASRARFSLINNNDDDDDDDNDNEMMMIIIMWKFLHFNLKKLV